MALLCVSTRLTVARTPANPELTGVDHRCVSLARHHARITTTSMAQWVLPSISDWVNRSHPFRVSL